MYGKDTEISGDDQCCGGGNGKTSQTVDFPRINLHCAKRVINMKKKVKPAHTTDLANTNYIWYIYNADKRG